MKITKENYQKYAAVNENGFQIDMHKLISNISHGDEYPSLYKVIYNDENKQIIINISFFKHWRGNIDYTIKAEEFKKSKTTSYMIGGSGYYSKELYKEENGKGRFNFEYLKKLCYRVDEETIKTVLNDYTNKSPIVTAI